MSRIKDLTGRRFNRLIVIRRHNRNATNGNALWECKCECGSDCVVDGHHLRSKHTQSCGCIQRERSISSRKKQNIYTFDKNIVIGLTTNTQKKFLVDLDDYEKIKEYAWCERNDGYIVSTVNGATTRLHRFILNTDCEVVDHINGDRSDNRRINLRPATKQLNGINRGANINNILGVKGVSRLKSGKYTAQITKNGKSIYIGTFESMQDAKLARYKKEKELFGTFAFREEGV